MKRLLTLALLLTAVTSVYAQRPKNFAVMMSATLVESPQPSITLHWDADKNATDIQIFRKAKEDGSWPQEPIADLEADAVEWTDTDVRVGDSYEYRVIRDVLQQVGVDTNTQEPIMRRYWAFGYMLSGIKAPPAPRGRVLILVDSTVAEPLTDHLATYRDDLESEGWTVDQRLVARTEAFDPEAVAAIRALIDGVVDEFRRDLTTIVLVGRVAVPYSGDVAPDGHVPDHRGAWPADGIYGDDNGFYTDQYINLNNTQRPKNANLPDDGKYDQSRFASNVESAVGRIDFFDMPQFEQSEIELLQAYFEKNHAFRSGEVSVLKGGIIDDHFGTYAEYFASAAWRSFSVFGTDTAVKAADWFESLAGPQTYLWAYGCGGGSFTRANGVGTTEDMATKPVEAIHTQLFGSYFGDWNVRNNFLRAAIASSPRALTCGWSARPSWYMHHMALGESIGYSLLISQNNRSIRNGALGTYTPNVIYNGSSPSLASIGDGGIHIALMGDPTLRAVMAPIPAMGTVTARDIGVTGNEDLVELSWDAPAGDHDGYMIYRWRSALRGWERITDQAVSSTMYRDTVRSLGEVQYRVHAVGLRSTASGTYYDIGKGAEVSLNTTSVEEDHSPSTLMVIAPNPAATSVTLQIATRRGGTVTIRIVDLTGTVMLDRQFQALASGEHQVQLNVSPLPVGTYRIQLRSADGIASRPLRVVR